MKVQPSYTRNYTEVRQNQNNKGNVKQNPSFGNFAVATMDAVEKGGLFASFAAQDLLGTCFPRTITGFYRNKDITGKYNYAEASEVSIREFVSSVTMFLIPMGMMYLIKKGIGKACDVPVNFIKGLGDTFKTVKSGDSAAMKKDFYKNAFAKMFKDSGLTGADAKAQEFGDKLIELEAKLAAKDKKGYKKGITELEEAFGLMRKEQTKNISENFYTASYGYGEKKTASTSFRNFVKHVRNYSSDALAKVEHKKPSDMGKFISKFNLKRIGARFMTNASMALAVILFYMYIPKLYTLHKTNPALAGLEPETKGTQQTDENQ